MDARRRHLAVFLLPLNLCGLILLMATASTQVDTRVRWLIRGTGVLLTAPAIALMLLTVPRGGRRGVDVGGEEDPDDEM